MSKKSIIITIASFVIGLIEALMYYNLGKKQSVGLMDSLPPWKDLVMTMFIVIITSVATALLTCIVERVIESKNRPPLYKYLIRK